MTYLKLKNLKD